MKNKQLEILRLQVKALKGSVKKWRKIVKGDGQDLGPDNCDCCLEFSIYNGCGIKYYCDGSLDCNDECTFCPIVLSVKETCCYGTPYWRWHEEYRVEYRRNSINKMPEEVREKAREAAKKMLMFIEKLYVKYSAKLKKVLEKTKDKKILTKRKNKHE